MDEQFCRNPEDLVETVELSGFIPEGDGIRCNNGTEELNGEVGVIERGKWECIEGKESGDESVKGRGKDGGECKFG